VDKICATIDGILQAPEEQQRVGMVGSVLSLLPSRKLSSASSATASSSSTTTTTKSTAGLSARGSEKHAEEAEEGGEKVPILGLWGKVREGVHSGSLVPSPGAKLQDALATMEELQKQRKSYQEAMQRVWANATPRCWWVGVYVCTCVM
jgi:hypothetical protein